MCHEFVLSKLCILNDFHLNKSTTPFYLNVLNLFELSIIVLEAYTENFCKWWRE